MKLFWCVAVFSLMSEGMANPNVVSQRRVIGQEVSNADQDLMKKIDYPQDIRMHEIVAVNHKGQWLYARVQCLPTAPLWMGLVNWVSPKQDDNYGGQAINYKRHVKKFLVGATKTPAQLKRKRLDD